MSAIKQELGIVIIGRNEGERLLRCIRSALVHTDKIIYVDSNSSDNSLRDAAKIGVDTIELDMSIPFSAARARNEGWSTLVERYPSVAYVHFIDGDCFFVEGWVGKAYGFLSENNSYAAACGRRREIHPEKSVYNALCDIEWNTPAGDTLACGGDALIRVDALNAVDGYRNHFIAGEEPEMCFRMREKGWKIRRIDGDMTRHDANITTFGQWWKRAKRCGYAYALGAHAHGRSAEKYKVKVTTSALIWGAVLPISIILLSVFISPLSLFLFGIYPLQVFRLNRKSKLDKSIRGKWACFIVLSKFPECLGILEFGYKKLFNKQSTIIEYK